ncbi:MAG TPA: ABC transporter substrate-binding protein [Thermodesulfobacteriota bacterium]|nr:ABC transporter substrate-binding protein [Thermodesulfobacteriota bacterium]
MKRILVVLLLIVATIVAASITAAAGRKKDNKPDGGSLSYGEYGRPATLDPITSNEMISLRITELIFNGLVGINEKQEIVPELAERWDCSADGRTYTFFLRKDVTWHPREGEEPKPFTAEDVVFTYKIMMHPKTITPLKVRYEFISAVEKLDDYAVKFTLKRPILNALAKFSFKVIPKHGPRNPLYLSRDDPFVQNPIGTGPYILKNITAEREIILNANDNYFKGRPHIDKLIAKPFADQNIMTQGLMFNAIDMIVLVNPRDLPEIQGDKRFILQPYNALSYSFFGYNVRNPLLADKRVRKAFTHAVNRQEMLDSFFNGQGTIISGPFAPGSWAYNLDVQPLSFDPEKARALLQEAGFSRGVDGFMQKDGKRLAFSLKVPIEKESEAVKRVVLAFKNYLKNIGADINVEFKEWQSWKEDVFFEHDFDIIFAIWVFDDSADISSLFHSGEIGAWKNNFGGYSNPEVDGLINESKLTLDHEKRRTINRKLHVILAEENPYTFLWTLTNYAAYHKKVRRVAIHPYKFFSYADDWFMEEKDQK